MVIRIETLRAFIADDAISIRIDGDCMRPQLARDALVRVKRARVLWPGDVVAFARADGALVAHRFLGYAWRNGTWRAVTKADDSKLVDSPVPVRALLGRVVTRDESNTRILITASDRLRAAQGFAQAVYRALVRSLRA